MKLWKLAKTKKTIKIIKISSKIGSDVVIGMQNKRSILYGNGNLKYLKNNVNLYTLLIRPNFGCSTQAIYNNVKNFSKPNFKLNKRKGCICNKI